MGVGVADFRLSPAVPSKNLTSLGISKVILVFWPVKSAMNSKVGMKHIYIYIYNIAVEGGHNCSCI